MPRYLVHTRHFLGDIDELVVLAERRFPEVTIERRYTLGGEPRRDAWVIRAATDIHIRRLASAAGLAIDELERIDTDMEIAAARSTTETTT